MLWKIIVEGIKDIWPALQFLARLFFPRPEEVKDNPVINPPVPVEPPKPVEPEKEVLLWDTPKHTWHSVRVMCDNSGLTFTQKNVLCACVWQESNFFNYLPSGKPVINQNIKDGKVWSTDWGLLQVNDHYWIGAGKLFPSVDYVLKNPAKVVQWMIDFYKANGNLNRWSSYSTGAYKKHLPLTSPMWKLAEK